MINGLGVTAKFIGRPAIVYTILAFCILGPLLKPGYILTWSMVAGPGNFSMYTLYGFEEWAHSLYPGSAPFDLLFLGLQSFLPAWFGQKILLLLVFFLSGLGAYRLVGLARVGESGKYYAGFLYAVNPFIYTRLLAGQWWLCLGYALTPLALWAFNVFLRSPSFRTSSLCVLLTSLVGIVYPQGLLLLMGLYMITGIMSMIYAPFSFSQLRKTVIWLVPAAGLFFLVNCYWLIPLITAKGTLYHQISDGDRLQFAATSVTSRGLLFDIASMHGFWRSGYIYAIDLLPLWEVWFLVVLFLAVLGATVHAFRATGQYQAEHERYRQYQTTSLCIAWILALFLAAGAASEVLRPGYEWLWDHVELLKGFRDSQKFVGVICLAYAFLGGLGIQRVEEFLRPSLNGLKKWLTRGLLAFLVVVPFVYTFTIFGFYNQVGSTDYPDGWYTAKEYFDQDVDEFRVLFLPWHWFMDYEWLPNRSKRLMNPGPSFFSQQVLHSDDHEVVGFPTQSTNPANQYIEFLLKNRNDIENFGELLAPLGVKYIVLVPEVDFDQYRFLYDQKDIVQELPNAEMTVFRNTAYTGMMYGVNSVRYIGNLEELLEISHKENLLEHLFVLGSGEDIISGDLDTQRVQVSRESPVRYQVDEMTAAYLLGTGYLGKSRTLWEYGQGAQMYNLGVVPAFAASRDSQALTYTRFYRVYWPSGVLSLVMLLVLAGWLVFGMLRKSI
jgi:hypothetical protein